MSKWAHVSKLVMIFLGKDEVPKHITINLFVVFETSGQTLVKKYKIFLKQYGLTKKIIVYVKNEGLI